MPKLTSPPLPASPACAPLVSDAGNRRSSVVSPSPIATPSAPSAVGSTVPLGVQFPCTTSSSSLIAKRIVVSSSPISSSCSSCVPAEASSSTIPAGGRGQAVRSTRLKVFAIPADIPKAPPSSTQGLPLHSTHRDSVDPQMRTILPPTAPDLPRNRPTTTLLDPGGAANTPPVSRLPVPLPCLVRLTTA